MALWICTACKTPYGVDAPACPHCGGAKHGTDSDPVVVGEHGPELAATPPASKTSPARKSGADSES